jgi:hypothetical protein
MEGANGFHVIDCLAMQNTVAGFGVEGTYSGGWFVNAIADQNAGDGFIIQDTALHTAEEIQMINCWSRSNRYGLWVK